MFIRKLSGLLPSRKRPGDHPVTELGLAASWKVAHAVPDEQLDRGANADALFKPGKTYYVSDVYSAPGAARILAEALAALDQGDAKPKAGVS